MMSLEVIIAVNEEIGVRASEQGLVPYVPSSPLAVDLWKRVRLPNIGYYEPDGWERTDDSWFVDKTGWGRPNEPALTLNQFKGELRQYVEANPEHGYAVTEEGEFQFVVSAFSRTTEE